jgi:hypothetical protein
VQKRKYPINEQFFDEIDSEEKAYFLGMLYADGTNSIKKTEVSLRLQEEDYEILLKLNDLLQPTKPIRPIIRDKRRKILFRMVMNSKKVSYRLNELGVVPNKTFKLAYPTWLNEKLENHFIRGYFDGDGCVTFNKCNEHLQISFTGTENMVLNIQRKLIDNAGLNMVKVYIRYPERNNNIRTLMYSGKSNSVKICDYLYENANLYMTRKKNKFNKHLNLN